MTYEEWLEKIYIETESVVLCEDMADEWCEKNCEYSSIQPICLKHFYETYIKDGERGNYANTD